MADNNEVIFKGRVVRQTYSNGDYRIYALDVSKEDYPDIKHSKYGTVSIVGEMHELAQGIEYEVMATEENTKYGYSYRVRNVKRDRPNTEYEMYLFLQEILTLRQAEELYKHYPNIVEKVINNDLADVDLNKLHGIKEYTFNVIKNKIIENFALADLVIKFQGYLSISMLKKLYDKYTSIHMIEKKLREDPYKCLCGLARVGFSMADATLLELEEKKIIRFEEPLRESPKRCLSCMLYLLEKNEEDGHTYMKIQELREQLIRLTPACSDNFIECMKHESVYYDKDKMIVALKSTYETEKYIAESIVEGLTKKNMWNCDINKYRIVDGCELSDEQIKIVENICKYNICILNGSGGTGKSFSTQAVINMLKDNDKTYRLFAPTGKAAKVMAGYTKEEATTIHRGLGYIPPFTWSYNQEHKMMCDVLIIDEFSMVDIQLFKHVVDALDFNTTKLLIIGDNAQLPSVACGNLLHDFMECDIIPTVTLTKVFRYSSGGLMKVATDARMSKPYLTNIKQQFTLFGDNKDYGFLNVDDKSIVKNVIALYKKLLDQGISVEDIQVLTSYKKGDYGTISLNNEIQKIANKSYGGEYSMKVGDTVYYKDDLVIQTVNNYKAKINYDLDAKIEFGDNIDQLPKETFIANGETGIIKEIDNNHAIIDFDGVLVEYERSAMQMCALAYSITIHKSQGSSIKNVIVVTPKAHTYMLNSNIIYVGLTRMKEKCYHIGNVDTVNMCVKKKANLSRNTLMVSLLRELLKSKVA